MRVQNCLLAQAPPRAPSNPIRHALKSELNVEMFLNLFQSLHIHIQIEICVTCCPRPASSTIPGIRSNDAKSTRSPDLEFGKQMPEFSDARNSVLTQRRQRRETGIAQWLAVRHRNRVLTACGHPLFGSSASNMLGLTRLSKCQRTNHCSGCTAGHAGKQSYWMPLVPG